MNWRLYITTGLLWTTLLGGTAEAALVDLTINLSSSDDDPTHNGTVIANGLWKIQAYATSVWHQTGGTDYGLQTNYPYSILYGRITNFYNPTNISIVTPTNPTASVTHYYIPYSNSLTVVAAGTTTSERAVFQLINSPPNEYQNSSFYISHSSGIFTDAVEFTTIPTGTYGLAFNMVRGYQSPPNTNVNITGGPYGWFTTNTYLPYTNGLRVMVAGINGTASVWTLSSRPEEYTNCALTNINFTNEYTITPIPTGTYVVTFPSLSGYTTPSAITSALTSGTNTITGTYAAVNGNLLITMTPSSVTSTAPWRLTSSPSGYTNGIYQGTGVLAIASVITGRYEVTFDYLAGYTEPAAAVSGNVLSNGTTTILGEYAFNGGALYVYLQAPYTRLRSLNGYLSSGASCRVQYGSAIVTQTAVEASYAVNAGGTVTLTALTNYVYKWYYNNDGATAAGIDGADAFNSTLSFQISASQTKSVWLVYSTPYYSYDNAGDIDHDELPDRWEYAWFDMLQADNYRESVTNQAEVSTNDHANGDDDFLPSASTNPPMQVRIDTNGIAYYAGAGGADPPDYPLRDSRLYTRQEAPVSANQFGYSTGIKFDNILECRGLDRFYLTNGPAGWIASDDPGTDPEDDDSDGDNLTDGWEYYFWYWRSANAYSAGMSNSANLSWVALNPTNWNINYLDTDRDGLTDLQEHDLYWTDPTHCDSDADGMDDYWEVNYTAPSNASAAIANSNALAYINNLQNPDGDYMAWVTDTMLTVGMVGTSLGTNVFYTGAATNPGAAWLDSYTNAGTNIFDLYQDTILKAGSTLTNHAVGTNYMHTNYYGTNTGLSAYRNGYPVWVDLDDSGTYSAGDVAIVNPNIKHDGVYCMAPATSNLYPGVCKFNPYTAWTNLVLTNNAAPETVPYTTYQEYLGADLVGRLSWDAGGQMASANDSVFALDRNSYSLPQNQDTDGDGMPDGWELYTGLNDNYASDAGLDSDDDGLNNHDEWANASHSLSACATNWPNKLLPTDPGIIIAPQPNDPHPKDTDWDGVTDGDERTPLSNPAAWDTDGDHLPDGWEFYAGALITTSDATADPDGDGLSNAREYWCGTVPEWMFCDPSWQTHTYFCVRRAMPWDPFKDPDWGRTNTVFIPPDYLTDPCFMYANNVYTNLGLLRTNYPARVALDYKTYHTPYAAESTTSTNAYDSDRDGMDDFWEVYHGLNPCQGISRLMLKNNTTLYLVDVDEPDADHDTPGYQFGLEENPFNSLTDYISYIEPVRTNVDLRAVYLFDIVGPFNLGLGGMDPDGDGLPNLEEYSYSRYRTLYHTDPSPIWRTDQYDTNSFVYKNYTSDNAPAKFLKDWKIGGEADGMAVIYPFKFENIEGYDTDNDGKSDYAEINSAAGQTGNNPLDERNPIRNRALFVNGTNDFARQIDRLAASESALTRFCVEAWIKPDNPAFAGNHVVMEKAGLYRDPLDLGHTNVGANFRMGIISNGLPYVLYNGRGSLHTWQATAKTAHRIASNTNWTHVAGSYDGTNLIIYVNGEESYSLRTTELPANGYNVQVSTGTFFATSHTLMVGARDNAAGSNVPFSSPSPANYFGGCIDEVRVWDGARTRAEILANKNRRLTQLDITNSAIYNYFTFDDVPDPNRSGEAIFPSGMADIGFDMHPAISWWQNYALHSTVYTGVTNSYNYMVYASDHAWHGRALTPPYDDYYHFSTNFNTNAIGTNGVVTPEGYINPSNPYHQINANANSIYDLLLFVGARSVATNSWLSGLSSDPDSTDSDGDGLPDWWEQLYNLDPNDATGNNGAWGDYDNDGLNNRAEYLAGTNPRNSDTAGDGIGDYDSRSGPYTRTYGEMYMDGDGMPDTWEMQYGLDPYHYDANLDLDKDGWSNYAEYQGGTDPSDSNSYPQPSVWGSADYFGNRSGTYRFFVYNTNLMDGTPKITKIGTGQAVAETISTANGTLNFTGRLPLYPIDQTTVVRISAPFTSSNTTVFVSFTFSGPGQYEYSGPGTDYAATLDYVTGRMILRWASVAAPAAGASVSVEYTYVNRNAAAFNLTGFSEGDFYLMALIDLNNNEAFDAGEPMGIMDDQPLTLGYTTLQNVKVHLRDSAPGYGRFAWTGTTTGTSDYQVVINKISESGGPTVLARTMRWPRNFVHEWDYQLAGYYGLGAGQYQWWMNSQQGTFTVSWPSSLSTPYLAYPRGDILNYAQNQFKWMMDTNSTRYHLQIARQNANRSLTYVLDNYYPTPYADGNGVYQAYLPLYGGELGNGVYYWRVAGWTPAGESAWSDAQTFEINLSATNSHWIAGDIYYFGKADSSNIIVEAFDNRGFSGKPEARILLTGASRTNSYKGAFALRGLPEGTYYVRAWLDVTPAGGTRDGKRNSPWESWGFIRDPNNDYQPRAITLLDTFFVDGTKLVIRDQDTDEDLLPDAWEMYYFGDLNQTGDMDYDGDGETNLEEYMRDGYDMNPAFWDTDGDGLSDAFEMNYIAPSFGYSAKSGLRLNPNLWDTDGDGYSDGAEIFRYHTDPLDPTSYPAYRPMCFDAARSPADYDGDGRSDLSVYDVASGNWHLMTAYGQSFNLPFGSSATQPMLGDYSGDGCDDFAVFEPATGTWYLYDAWSGQSFRLKFGDSEMTPVPSDYDGDNKTDMAVYYPAEGMWYIYSAWSGQFFSLKFGGPTMTPLPADYNNDGAADLGLYESASGDWNFFVFDHYRHEGKYYSGNFGGPTMAPAPGDYDGDGRNDAALFETSTGNWYILTWRGQFFRGQFGWYGCIPVPGDYDGDGRSDLAVYYPPTGMWYIYCWSGQSYQVQLGWSAAAPILKGRM